MQAVGHAPARPSNAAAAVLSLVIPGAGQMYKGKMGLGMGWLVLTLLGYLTVLLPGIFLHFLCVFQAYCMDAEGWKA